jgi:hypothetical protein
MGQKMVPKLVSIRSADNSEVKIIANSVYKLERLTRLGGPSGSTITMHLTKELTPEEQELEDQEAMEYLDKLIEEGGTIWKD